MSNRTLFTIGIVPAGLIFGYLLVVAITDLTVWSPIGGAIVLLALAMLVALILSQK